MGLEAIQFFLLVLCFWAALYLNHSSKEVIDFKALLQIIPHLPWGSFQSARAMYLQLPAPIQVQWKTAYLGHIFRFDWLIPIFLVAFLWTH
jgi:hypothetical protein